MMRTIIALFLGIIFLTAGSLSAVERKFGAGIMVNDPSGISGKYWLSDRNAVDGGISTEDGGKLYLHADYLWHDYKAFPKPEEGRLPLYYGGGMRVAGDDVGLRGVAGISYIFSGYPFDIFLELAPVLALNHETGLYFYGSFGARYYFGQ